MFVNTEWVNERKELFKIAYQYDMNNADLCKLIGCSEDDFAGMKTELDELLKSIKQESGYDKWIAGKEDIIAAACRRGAMALDLCAIIGCGKTTFFAIKRNSAKFRELLKENEEKANLKVEYALFKRACGFNSVEETKLFNDKGEVSYTKVITKTIPPDTGAAMSWLKNRKPGDWRDRHDVDVSVNPFLELMKQATGEEND